MLMTFLFVDISGYATEHFDWIAKIQFVPALLALNVIVVVGLVVLTLIFGRVYCSVICPLGVFQDFVSWIRRRTVKKTRRRIGLFGYKPARTKTRNIFLGLFVVVVILGLLNVMAVSLGAIIEPYSAFGRIVTAFVSPMYDAGNNVLADWSVENNNYMFTPVSRVVPGVLFAIAAVTLVVVVYFSWTDGRAYCNTVCPVGTLLGFISRFAWFRVVIDTGKCNGCMSCQRKCKASCIDSKNHAVDYSRCVDCMDCIGACRQGAITFRPVRKADLVYKPEKNKTEKVTEVSESAPAEAGRRRFMASLGLIGGALMVKSVEAAVGKVTDGGLTPLKDKQTPVRKIAIVPPGAISPAHISAHCVGCQLCVQACPSGLLTMSTDLSTLMHPRLDYINGYCPPECTKCSNVCPAGVFKPLDVALKSSWKVGTAVVNLEACLSANGTDYCGNCQRHCPAGAITMVPVSEGSDDTMPVVDPEMCIGCGACEYHCPVGSVASMSEVSSAIHVEGVVPQREI